ncbi:Siderophore-interacting protein [Streptomyces sp. HCCB10043]|uniref:SIP domain-containing protein n=1 Tax=Streptomyces TaxID=1883 RepID=UPI0003045FD9|nr:MULTISPECIES: SIP domain-containing protein [Streptomyces]ESU46916.1 Siderophore-interacting protein [Streptomyces sp. HCCB10043]
MIGDETALPAIGRWLAEMPAGTRARVFIEAGEESHRRELPTEADATVTWLTRDGAPAGSTDLLERAVRSMEWLPGEVYVWAAGEAVTLKGIRRHLSTERGGPRERTHITGYWRRTEPDPVAGAGQAEDDAHERLHELTDLAPGFAIRSAVTLGLFDLVRDGVSGPAELARRTGAEPSLLGALLTYLVAIGLLEADGDGHRLTAVSEELVEDDHSSDEYHLGGAQAAMDLSLVGLPHTLRTGEPGYRTAGGDRVATAMLADERLAGSARAAVEEEARWVAPGVSGAYDWASVISLTAGGHGVGTLVNALVKAYPAPRVRITALPSELRVLREEILDTDVAPRVELSPRTGPVPHGGSTVLVSRLLERLADEDAVLALSEAAGALPADGTLLLVEQTRPDGPDEDAALQHLRLACLFGSGLRSQEELEALTERAGLRIRRREDVGWDHRMWVLGPAGGR